MRGIKGFLDCKGDHNTNHKHTREEVTKVINKLKEPQPSAFLSQDDVDYIDEILS